MAGYQRQDADGNISNGNIIDATDLNDEFNAVESAFNSTNGHAHDGTAGNGARIEVTGPTGEYVFTSDSVRPAAGETSLDIGASANRFDNGYFNHIDTNGVVFNGGTELTSVDTTITTGSNTAVPTSLAVKNYVDTNITAQDLDITDGTNTTAIDLDSESLTFTGSTGLSATVSDNTVTFSTTDSEIVHDNLSGFVADEHVDHSTVSIFGGTGLSGGGNITASRTINLSHLGLENLNSPGADRIAFFDQSSGSFQWLEADSNLTISSTTLTTNPSLTDTNSISGGSNFTIGHGSGNSLFIQENSVNKVEINKNLLDFKETSGVVNIETQGASLIIGDTSATTTLQLNGVSAIQNYNSTAFQVVTVGAHIFQTAADLVTFRAGASSSQKIQLKLDSGEQTIQAGETLNLVASDTGKINFGNATTPETLNIDFTDDLFTGTYTGTSINSVPTNSSLAIRAGEGANGFPGSGDLYFEAGTGSGQIYFLSGDKNEFYQDSFSSANKYLTLERYGTGARITSPNGNLVLSAVATFTRRVILDPSAPSFKPGDTTIDYDLGTNTYKWDDIYATNGTIQTSDATLKQDVVAISEAETRVAQALKGLLRKYRWISSVEAKGDAARYHFGIMAQDVKQAFEDEGLDPFEYAMLTKAVEWVVEETEGEPEVYSTQAEAPEGAVETTTWGVRYVELLAFIIAGM